MHAQLGMNALNAQNGKSSAILNPFITDPVKALHFAILV